MFIMQFISRLVPESPRWLVSRGRFDQASEVIRRIARLNGCPIPDEEKIIFKEEECMDFCLDANGEVVNVKVQK